MFFYWLATTKLYGEPSIAAFMVTKRNIDSKFIDYGPIYLMDISKLFKILKHSKYGRKLAGLV
jgi:hypothetical protein